MWKGHGSEVQNILNSEHNYNCSGGDRINSIKTLISNKYTFQFRNYFIFLPKAGKLSANEFSEVIREVTVTAKAKEIH